MKLTWANVDEADEPRWGDRWSVQENDNGKPLYMIHNRYRSILGKGWVVSRGDGSHVGDGDTLAYAKAIAQDDYDNSSRAQS